MATNLKLLSAGCLCALAALALASCSASSNAKDVKPATESPGSIIVAVTKVGAADLTRDIVLTGEFRPYQVIEVHAKVAGYLKRINVDVGDRAESVLACLDVPGRAAPVGVAGALPAGRQRPLGRTRPARAPS